MSLGIKHLSKSITTNTIGIVWLTDDNLDFSTPGVYEFNYLLDGVLLESLSENKNSDASPRHQQNYFLGDNFDSKLFIGHVVIKDKKDIKKMYDVISLSSAMVSKDSQILIFNRSKNTANVNILKELSQKYPDILFENLNI